MADPNQARDVLRLLGMLLGGAAGIAGCFLLVKILRLFDGAAEALSQPDKCEMCSIPLDLTDGCPNCGVYHGDPCFACGRRGYHRMDCSEMEDDTPAGGGR